MLSLQEYLASIKLISFFIVVLIVMIKVDKMVIDALPKELTWQRKVLETLNTANIILIILSCIIIGIQGMVFLNS